MKKMILLCAMLSLFALLLFFIPSPRTSNAGGSGDCCNSYIHLTCLAGSCGQPERDIACCDGCCRTK